MPIRVEPDPIYLLCKNLSNELNRIVIAAYRDAVLHWYGMSRKVDMVIYRDGDC